MDLNDLFVMKLLYRLLHLYKIEVNLRSILREYYTSFACLSL